MSDVTQYLYKIQPARPEMLVKGPTPEEEAVVSQHFAYLQRLLGEGVVILAGRTLNTDESSFGIVIFNAPSEEAARRVMHDDPAVQAGVMRAELYPYRIALMAGGAFAGNMVK
ncbi:MAG: YciI family protein [Chloroflexi bacterium]|nr:YciI family protein [Chloroflexota bacterium]MBU1746127.1 YciI family protein [Chloroflexota bacterium]